MSGFKAFHNVNFPVPIARGARITTKRQTQIVTLGSGHEERSTRWRFAKRTFDAGGGLRSLSDLQAVQAFFESRMGQLYAFRFRDPVDHASSVSGNAPLPTDQALGLGDGTTTEFKLTKTYGTEPARDVTLPVSGSVVAALDATTTTNFTLSSTGKIKFAVAPAAGVAVTAGYLFDVPARFDTDALDIDLTAFSAGAMPAIPLIEVFLQETDSA